ncbi:cysteine desulfurase [Aggregatibacter actinomycetemcomitans]|uniref:aminotransferase class V-fold PLP-dependent enzyme n=2 Tax=Aggregatibacter actinomycetemcomitans TaxID=714 RepID=UPI00022AB8D4|nr:aminotransferase class V-fold PLP-dependent enzyme [Aggregatibacter actinomycetemcomitans]KYK95916.1 cysteine desulfurase [Aggregatibacter actinomycetemcomitans serotype d str. SA3733]ANU82424.1 cysteine desulfurase [Aggregatibacter actinomycetemcomitans]KOE67066.1 cysteine desulfurase [Aggregatibacter actinomycetemcomitans serotype d str. I63B]KYK84627.1 cysteine desulfurase [Aggregatibacter actinomycetemcomitans serotype d str. SA3033]MBN6072642.1 aminotransferase class V-fold PLP-depende
MDFDPVTFRQYFPYFTHSDAVVYLDNAATTLKPQCLIEATVDFYQSAGSVHRSQYDEKQTALYEQARTWVKQLINAEDERAVIWTSGTTQAINTVANGLLPHLQADDEIIISEADHHANFVTWHQIAEKSGTKIHVLPIGDDWLIDAEALRETLNSHTKLVALNFASNVTGTQQAVKQLIQRIRANSSALVLLDAAQAISHIKIDLAELDADFIAFSAHKIYGPTGLGVLSGKLSALDLLQPLQYGGKMINKVSKQQITFAELPYRLEAGTPNIAAVIGFNAVLEWLAQWDIGDMEETAVHLAEITRRRLSGYAQCKLFNSPQPSSVVSFIFGDVNASDLATLLAEQNIALRVGEHCAQPYLARLGQTATLRLSFAPYNIEAEVDTFFNALDKALALLR